MRYLNRFLITLPLLLMPLPLVIASSPASAAGTAAQEAVRILSRARTADSRCQFLSRQERAELGRYTARAEIAAASQISAAAAKAAAAAGRSEGKSAACSEDTRADVRETLQAAREAIAASNPPRRKTGAAQTTDGEDEDLKKQRPVRLDHYRSVVTAYYVERRCRHLSKPQADRFWRAIVRIHKSTVLHSGAGAVSRVMRRAERAAGSVSCGHDSTVMVKAGFAESVNR